MPLFAAPGPRLRLGWVVSLCADGPLSRQQSQLIASLFHAHAPAVFRRARRMLGNAADAEEATQEIFVRVLRSAEAFEHQAKLTTWLYQITTNYCLNVLRDRKRRAELYEEHVAPSEGLQGRAQPVAADDLALLRRLLATGDERQVQAAVYVYLDGMSHEEASVVLGVSKRTVGNLLERFSTWAKAQTAGADDAQVARQWEG